jgi:hypothetical protein
MGENSKTQTFLEVMKNQEHRNRKVMAAAAAAPVVLLLVVKGFDFLDAGMGP